MLTQTNRRKRLTRQDGAVPSAESTARGRASDMQGAPLALLPSVDQRRSGVHTLERGPYQVVPVVDSNQKPLMPTTPSRARRWIKNKEATPFFKRGIFCVRLNREPSAQEKQPIAVGIDPGSKKEGFTVKSKAHPFLNIQADAVQHVKDAVETRRMMRRTRRSRKTPYRASRMNRKQRGSLAPSTKARWQWKIRIVAQLAKMFPITDLVVEDIKARTVKGVRKWNKSFSPLEIGKTWFYKELEQFGKVHLKQGWETKALRDAVGLKKSKAKLSEVFAAHCVDSWVLANWLVGGHTLPENTNMLCISPIRFHRRQLHVMVPAVGGIRKPYGGTRSSGFKRGSLVSHPKYGLTYVGGVSNKGLITLQTLKTGVRVYRNAKPEDLVFRSYNVWRVW